MALQKTWTISPGNFLANYWKIHSIENLNLDSESVEFKLALYKDSSTRTSDINDIGKMYNIELSGTDFPLDITSQDVTSKNTSKLIYEKIKTISELPLHTGDTVDFTTDTSDV